MERSAETQKEKQEPAQKRPINSSQSRISACGMETTLDERLRETHARAAELFSAKRRDPEEEKEESSLVLPVSNYQGERNIVRGDPGTAIRISTKIGDEWKEQLELEQQHQPKQYNGKEKGNNIHPDILSAAIAEVGAWRSETASRRADSRQAKRQSQAQELEVRRRRKDGGFHPNGIDSVNVLRIGTAGDGDAAPLTPRQQEQQELALFVAEETRERRFAAASASREGGKAEGAGDASRGDMSDGPTRQSQVLAMRRNPYLHERKPEWHAPWKLMRVISGHNGWVRSLAVDAGNEWFVSGSVDRTIKVWDLASGELKLTLTGHIGAVRGLEVSTRSPYLFSAGDDKMVKCWDLETNKAIRSYHGHLSGVYCLALHPQLDVLVTAGRDSVARVWDIRTKAQVHVLGGHESTIACVEAQASDPQIITGSHDTTVRLWDIRQGTCAVQLTHHKKSVRGMAMHPHEFTFATGAADNIKKWKLPDGNFMHNLSGHQAVVNCMAVNEDGVLVSGADNGSMHFWDYRTGYDFQQLATIVQPGSLEAEAGVFCTSFDRTGSRLIVGEADKTIKVYREDPYATEDTHPIGDWKKQVSQRY